MKINDSSKENILLLCDVPPCKNYSGGIASLQLAKMVVEEKIPFHCFCIMNPELKPEFDESIKVEMNLIVTNRPSENLKHSNKSYGRYLKTIDKKVAECLKFINKNNITKIWCTAQGEVMTIVMNAIFEKTKIPYIVQIWDPIDWWMLVHEFDTERELRTKKAYHEMIQNSEHCITASDNMSLTYEAEYGISCTNIITSTKRMVPRVLHESNQFIVAISGQIYSKDETEKLLDAFEEMKWKHKDKDIFFYFYGMWNENYIDLSRYSKNHIVIHEHLPQDELVNELAKTDLLYCPYFFSEEDALKSVSKLSFPSKLVTYLSVKIPIIVHGPEYCSPYKYIEKYNAGYLLNTLNVDTIVTTIQDIIDNYENKYQQIIDNSFLAYQNFSYSSSKDKFMNALKIEYSREKKLKILEINNVDLPGRRFNGYDLQLEINENTPWSAKQLVAFKTSTSDNVYHYFKNEMDLYLENGLIDLESKILSVHSQLSLTSPSLKNSDLYKEADVVHYHLIHNTKLSLNSLPELMNNKPSILSIHDPWIFTGRCVYPQECELWKEGCKNCPHLDNLFPFWEDNCASLYKLKEKVFRNLDIDLIVTTPYMLDLLKTSSITKHFKNVHVIPFGIDLNKFDNKISKIEARANFRIPNDHIVLFFRAQKAMKGTEYIVKALHEMKTDRKITLLSCSEVGLLDGLKHKYNVIDLGHIEDEDMVKAYAACDVFLMPSKGESFGLMAIEAMASSKPIIIFDNSALPHVTFAPKCGVLVKNKDSHALMEAIKWLVEDDEERIKRGNLGRKLAEKHYDLNTYNQRILDLYEEVYNRYKDRPYKSYTDNKPITTNSNSARFLLERLSKISNKLFSREILNVNYDVNAIDRNQKIDYSLDEVQNILNHYSDIVYKKEIHDNEKRIINSYKTTGNSLIYYLKLLKNDRQQLKYILKSGKYKDTFILKVIVILYKILRRIKNFILCR